MLNSRPTLFISSLIVACLVTLSCSLTGELLESLTPATIPAASEESTPNPASDQITPTLRSPTATTMMDETEQPTSTVHSAIATKTTIPIEPLPSATATQGGAGLSGVTFFDYDGDGLRGDLEPGVAGVWVCVNVPQADHCTQSDADGFYVLEGLPPDQHKVYVLSPSDDPSQAFRFVNIFKGWTEIQGFQVGDSWVPGQELPQTELRHIEEPLMVDVQPDTRLDIALIQGYLSDIFACGDRSLVRVYQSYDLDPREGYVRNYQESESRTLEYSATVLTGDNHLAIDWGGTNQHIIGTPLYAPANGIVIYASVDKTANGDCMVVNMVHPETGDSSGILHLEKVLVRDQQEVLRGQLLGTLGQSCATWPHVHFFLRSGDLQIDSRWEGIDPYRDTADPTSFSFWTKDNDPQCPTFVDK